MAQSSRPVSTMPVWAGVAAGFGVSAAPWFVAPVVAVA